MAPNYAKRAKPLIRLIRKNGHFVWTQEQQNAFDDLNMAWESVVSSGDDFIEMYR
jgi:hypothetical protein